MCKGMLSYLAFVLCVSAFPAITYAGAALGDIERAKDLIAKNFSSDYRLAGEKDLSQEFLCRGDFNGDGRTDLAVVMVSTSDESDKKLVIFHSDQPSYMRGFIEHGDQTWDGINLLPRVTVGSPSGGPFAGIKGDGVKLIKSGSDSLVIYWDGQKYAEANLPQGYVQIAKKVDQRGFSFTLEFCEFKMDRTVCRMSLTNNDETARAIRFLLKKSYLLDRTHQQYPVNSFKSLQQETSPSRATVEVPPQVPQILHLTFVTEKPIEPASIATKWSYYRKGRDEDREFYVNFDLRKEEDVRKEKVKAIEGNNPSGHVSRGSVVPDREEWERSGREGWQGFPSKQGESTEVEKWRQEARNQRKLAEKYYEEAVWQARSRGAEGEAKRLKEEWRLGVELPEMTEEDIPKSTKEWREEAGKWRRVAGKWHRVAERQLDLRAQEERRQQQEPPPSPGNVIRDVDRTLRELNRTKGSWQRLVR